MMKLIKPEEAKELIGKEGVKIVEVDYDPESAYNIGHIPTAILLDWKKDLNKYPERDIIDKESFERLMSEKGISNDDLIILYGDYNNWFAAFALWIFDIYGHDNVKILDGGRNKWIDLGYPMTTEVPKYPRTEYKVAKVDLTLRAYFIDVLKRLRDPNTVLIDVRSPAEFNGEITAPPEYPNEQTQRAGHIPGAVNIPWAKAVNEDGTLKSPDEIRRIYEDAGIAPDKDVIVYCRIGERAAFTYFVLRHVLGLKNVRVYDGSWSEWGNLVGVPIEK